MLGQKDFQLLDANQTGVTFTNTVTPDLQSKANLFDFDYFYNGSGVGVLDVNNDGLLDLYFAGNQVENKLYLNKGNFRFEDITITAFGEYHTNWSTGVSIVDINNDGWQDIYVCQGGPYSSERRKNLLFVNQQNNTFLEQAKLYGLADEGISSQAVFFDFDKDGDLDCFVMNESLAYGLDPVTFTRLNLEKKKDLSTSFSHFYVNNDGVYTDKSAELGLNKPTFGLGIKLADFNDDGWKDIYVANDYYVPDMMLINQQGKGFVDEINARVDQMSFYGMGLDIADINNDGESDLFVLDMASGDHYRSKTLMRSMNVENFRLLVDRLELPYQYMFNSLQLANKNKTFDNIAHLAGVSSTDWSWSALIEDFDLDGYKDIHVTNGYRKYALDNDFQASVRQAHQQYSVVPLDVKKELYEKMPTEKLQNIFFRNKGNLKFEKWGISYTDNPPSFSNGAAVSDLDNDGDLDLVVNNLDDESFIYKNMAVEKKKNNFISFKNGDGSNNIEKVTAYNGDEMFSYETSIVRGYLSSSEPMISIGLGENTKLDSVVIKWSTQEINTFYDLGLNKIHTVTYDSNRNSTPPTQSEPELYFEEIYANSIGLEFSHKENDYDDFEREILLPYKQSSIGPFVNSFDFSGDGLEDLVMSNSRGAPVMFYIQTNKGFEKAGPYYDSLLVDQEIGKINFTDVNNDGQVDFLFSASGNELEDGNEFYQSKIGVNTGKRIDIKKLPLTSGSTSKIIQIDYDNDGDFDLIECKRHVAQKYPKHAASILYENDNATFKDRTEEVFPDLQHYGIINDAIVTDLDKDGWKDVIIVGEWSTIGFFKNKTGTFVDVSKKYQIPSESGMWFSVKEMSINNDEFPDFIVGNLGKNSKYKASLTKPLKVYAKDFDDNGTWDLVLSKPYKDEYVPLRGLECSSQQMPFIQDKFETYDLFAKASLDEVYGTSLEGAYYKSVESFESIVLISNEDGTYRSEPLPVDAQLFPILDIEVFDINNDGMEDVLLAGNIYDTEVETPRLDAGQGVVLINKGNSEFKPINGTRTGIDLTGNIKSITRLFHKGGNCNLLVATENNGEIRTFVHIK